MIIITLKKLSNPRYKKYLALKFKENVTEEFVLASNFSFLIFAYISKTQEGDS